MRAITSAEIASMQTCVGSALSVDCTIYTRSDTIGSAGGSKPTFTAALAAIKCNIFPLSAKETMYADKLQGVQGWTIILPYNTTLSIKDKLYINSKYYEVIGVKTYPSSPALLRVICTQII